ncbi:GTPase IMAP family member 8-like isoform X2 [Alosa sapidissima]|uniref:GTPase IMAP family member 8-like isoform X2 n=1 Tax=Alosa sapidissima TaxID=34773 RepID=UPI001C08D92D|nr:GTPase IMAP family member 8-like isoform X2 [Alosa sapidissima]
MAAQMVCKQDDLQIIVLGYNRSGKTATINTFLGVGAYHQGEGATHSVKREGVVVGRKVTLIDTPGWWKLYSATQTAEYIKRELVLSTSLCPPGPHALLLVVELDSPFTEIEYTSVVEHCELLGANIWEHTIVLFTKGDLLTDKTIEERIKSQEEKLDQLVARCGGRYQVFDNKTKCDDRSQVKTLLDKLDELIASDHHHPFEVDHIKLKDIEEAKKVDKERGLINKERILEERQRIKINGEVLSLPEIRMILVGWVLSGKSYAGNIILNGDHFTPGKVTEKAESRKSKVFGRNLTVVDTPGWWKFLPAKYTPTRVKAELRRGVFLCGKYPQAILLTLTVETSFHEERRRMIQEMLEMYLGQDVWRHTIILFTWGNLLKDTTIEEVIESEGKALQWLIQKCGNRYHVFGERAQGSNQVEELLEKIEEMVAGNCVFCPSAESCMYTETGIRGNRVEERNDPQTEDAINIVDREWLRTDKNLIEEVQKQWIAATDAARKHKSNTSRNEPPNLQGEGHSTDIDNYGETFQDNPLYRGTADKPQSEKSDHSLQRQQSNGEMLAFHLKDMLGNEWRRRDFIVKKLVREAVQELKLETSSEPDPKELRESRDKVVGWLLKSSGYASYMSGSQEHLNVSDKDCID